jgi:altronate hydrolase
MYGVLVGKTQSEIQAGGLLSTKNVKHAANSFLTESHHHDWHSPDVSSWQGAPLTVFTVRMGAWARPITGW